MTANRLKSLKANKNKNTDRSYPRSVFLCHNSFSQNLIKSANGYNIVYSPNLTNLLYRGDTDKTKIRRLATMIHPEKLLIVLKIIYYIILILKELG